MSGPHFARKLEKFISIFSPEETPTHSKRNEKFAKNHPMSRGKPSKKNQSIFLDKTQDELFTAGPLGNEGRARCVGKNLNIMNIDDTSITRSSPLDRASRAVHYYYFYRGRAPPPPSPPRTSGRFFLSSLFSGGVCSLARSLHTNLADKK